MAADPASTDLQELYRSRLEPRLAALEGERTKLRFAIFASVLLVGLPALAFCGADIIGPMLPGDGETWLPPVSIALVFVGAGIAFWKFRDYPRIDSPVSTAAG